MRAASRIAALAVRARGLPARVGLVGLLGAGACGDAHYISLGSNDSAVRNSGGADGGRAGARGDDARAGTWVDGAEGTLTCAKLGQSAAASDFTCAHEPDLQPICEVGAARVALSAACDQRPLLACPELGESAELTLSGVLASVLRECNELDNVVSVHFEQGCARAFELGSDATALAAVTASARAGAGDAGDAGPSDAGPSDVDRLDAITPERASIRRCVSERLAAQRFECARDIACGLGASIPPLTR